GAGIDQGDVGHLADGHGRTVVFDLNVIENACVGAAGAQLAKIAFQVLDRLGHPGFSRLADFCETHDDSFNQTCTSVPSSSPAMARRRAPGLLMENTLIGSFWSRQRANAVASMTSRRRTMASSKLMREYRVAVGSLLGSAL